MPASIERATEVRLYRPLALSGLPPAPLRAVQAVCAGLILVPGARGGVVKHGLNLRVMLYRYISIPVRYDTAGFPLLISKEPSKRGRCSRPLKPRMYQTIPTRFCRERHDP